MSGVVRIEAVIYVESENDPEEVCGHLHAGLERALAGFPGGEVLSAGVESGRYATDDELEENGLNEA
jgi:hypothetical protein